MEINFHLNKRTFYETIIMPRRSVLSELEKLNLLKIPIDLFEMSQYYLLSETDISIINQKRGVHNKLGFSLLLCLMRYPGSSFSNETVVPVQMLEFII